MRKLFTILSLFIFALPATATDVVVKHGWVREAPPVSRVQAGYVEIQNNSTSDMKLVSIDSPDFGSVELHETRLENGVMSMNRLDQVVIPAGKSLVLEPEGKHLMLFNPAKPLRAGDPAHFEFTFKNGHVLPATLEVKKATGGMNHEHMHHEHMHH